MHSSFLIRIPMTHGVAAAVAKGITAKPQHTAEIIDLTAEGF
jgi:NAD(P)H dehydrogenase (quinone)